MFFDSYNLLGIHTFSSLVGKDEIYIKRVVYRLIYFLKNLHLN